MLQEITPKSFPLSFYPPILWDGSFLWHLIIDVKIIFYSQIISYLPTDRFQLLATLPLLPDSYSPKQKRRDKNAMLPDDLRAAIGDTRTVFAGEDQNGRK